MSDPTRDTEMTSIPINNNTIPIQPEQMSITPPDETVAIHLAQPTSSASPTGSNTLMDSGTHHLPLEGGTLRDTHPHPSFEPSVICSHSTTEAHENLIPIGLTQPTGPDATLIETHLTERIPILTPMHPSTSRGLRPPQMNHSVSQPLVKIAHATPHPPPQAQVAPKHLPQKHSQKLANPLPHGNSDISPEPPKPKLAPRPESDAKVLYSNKNLAFLPATFIDRIPTKMKSDQHILVPDSILMRPMSPILNSEYSSFHTDGNKLPTTISRDTNGGLSMWQTASRAHAVRRIYKALRASKSRVHPHYATNNTNGATTTPLISTATTTAATPSVLPIPPRTHSTTEPPPQGPLTNGLTNGHTKQKPSGDDSATIDSIKEAIGPLQDPSPDSPAPHPPPIHDLKHFPSLSESNSILNNKFDMTHAATGPHTGGIYEGTNDMPSRNDYGMIDQTGSGASTPKSTKSQSKKAGDTAITIGRHPELELSPVPIEATLVDVKNSLLHDPTHSIEKSLGSEISPWQPTDERHVIEVFLEEIGAALTACALPTSTIEFYLTLIAHRLHIDLEYVSVGNAFWLTFHPSSTSHLVNVKKPFMSLAKMVDVSGVCEAMLHGEISPVEGLSKVQQLSHSGMVYPSWTFLPAMLFVSFFYAPMFNCGWTECVVSAISGLLIGLLELFMADRRNISRGHDLLSGVIGAFVAVLCYSYVHKINLLAAIFGGIVWSLPGLSITLGMLDMATGNPVTGTAKFMSAGLTVINLGIGAIAGLALGRVTGIPEAVTGNILSDVSYGTVPDWFIALSILGVTPPQLVLLDAHWRHSFQFILCSALAYYISSYATLAVGPSFGAYIAAAIVSIVSNIYERLTNFPGLEVSLFSFMMLVPGSIGVRSILAQTSESEIDLAVQMLGIAIAIVTGLFTAGVVFPPFHAL